MEFNRLFNKYDINDWLKYKPRDAHYVKFLPNQVIAGLKIDDVYSQILNARESLALSEIDDFGERIVLAHNNSLKRLHLKFLFDALASYNYAIDSSWQMIYLYLGEEEYEILLNKQKYYKALRGCTRENLLYLLRLAGNKKVYYCVESLFNDLITKELREYYNYIKHRGTYNIEGLKESIHRFPFEVEGKEFRGAYRETLNIDTLKRRLIEFDVLFHEYFKSLILMLFPKDFQNPVIKARDFKTLLEKLFENGFLNDDDNITKLGLEIPGHEIPIPKLYK
ncbi:hypothetical protein [Bacillus mycoides]|uniref:Uncharacterized protein n=1 Tax=Bacillus mycoides TaxID=1405 RepID=A0ABC9QWA0_BACMY|nr:hypothetical protein [Bacillus mycoides]EJR31146.1 hypothetical protein III_05372 [Bacillus mycoides]